MYKKQNCRHVTRHINLVIILEDKCVVTYSNIIKFNNNTDHNLKYSPNPDPKFNTEEHANILSFDLHTHTPIKLNNTCMSGYV